jgi:ribonuclease D
MAALSRIRGLDARHLKGGAGEEILAAVMRGRALPPESLELPAVDDVTRELRPAIALASAWVSQLARDERIDAGLVATRADLVAYLRSDADARLRHGWRAGIVGDRLGQLVSGNAALAFDGRGGLLIEARSHLPLEP